MPESLQDVRDYRDLLATADEGSPYAFDTLFPRGGMRAHLQAKKKFKLLKRLDGDLRNMLWEGERVLFVTRGTVSVSFWEWFFLGWAMYYLNRRAIVLTSHRIILMQITSRGWPRELREQMEYEGIAELRTTFLGNTKVRFHGTDDVLLTGIPRPDRKRLTGLIEGIKRELSPQRRVGSVRSLCPHCYEPVTQGLPSCATCGGAFKSPKTAAVLSALYPGAGDFYLGHRSFAAVEVLGATALWLGIFLAAQDPSLGATPFLFAAVLVVAVSHTGDAFATRHIAGKGIYPHDGKDIRWRYAAAGVIPLAVIAFSAFQLPVKGKLRPPATVVAGDELTASQLAALREGGFLDPAESILYFYSPGFGSVLEQGSVLTDRRVISYALLGQSIEHVAASFAEVIALPVDVLVEPRPLTVAAVVLADGRYFPIALSPAEGRDVEFLDELRSRWRTAHRAVPGVWFDGGMGRTRDDPVLIRGMGSNADTAGAERQWMVLMFGAEHAGWEMQERSLAGEGEDGSPLVERVVVTLGSGETTPFYFAVDAR